MAESNPDCIFCKIVRGAIPSYCLYEDESVFSFLDIGPLSEGHCLVVPKNHYETIDRMPPAEAAACAAILPSLSRALISVTGAVGWNILQNNGTIAGQEVAHVHFHLIPRAEGDGLGYRWPAGKLDGDAAKRLVASIKGMLEAEPR